jgi:AbrB family looped-hinge helix DNA binding protein
MTRHRYWEESHIIFSENMNDGDLAMVVKRKLVRVQERGQITLPVEFRRKWDLKPGDLVAVEETPTGAAVVPQRTIPAAELEEREEIFRNSGITLEEWIESAREERVQIVKELHRIDLENLTN